MTIKIMLFIILISIIEVTIAAKCKCGWWLGDGWPTNKSVTQKACRLMGKYYEHSTNTCWIYESQSHILDMYCTRADKDYKLAGCDH